MRRILVIAVVGASLATAACSGGSSGGSNETPGLTGSSTPTTTAANTPDQLAAAYERDVTEWVSDVKSATDELNDYPKQINVQHDSVAQLTAQRTSCSTATSTATKVQTPPVLDSPRSGGSSAAYSAAVKHDRALRKRAAAVLVQLQAVVRFCTWLNALESGETTANAANASLFSQPLRYTGTIKVKGVEHTCPKGASCYTPDQSLWPRISQLWQQQGAATAQGANAIKQGHIPCLIKGWDAMCDLVVQNQLDYQKWTGEYAKAFDDNKDKDLPTANAAISAVGAKFDSEVLVRLANLPGIYRQLAPGQKYDARVSTTGENIWIAHVTGVLKQLQAAVAKL